MSENRVQRGIFRPKRVKITGGWRKLHKKELRDLPNIVRLVKHVEDMRKEKNAQRLSYENLKERD